MFAVKKKVTKTLLGPKRAKKGPNLTIFQFYFKNQLKMMLEVWILHCLVEFSLIFKIEAKKMTFRCFFSHSRYFFGKNVYFFLFFFLFFNFWGLLWINMIEQKLESFPKTAFSLYLSFKTINRHLGKNLRPGGHFYYWPPNFQVGPQKVKIEILTSVWSCNISKWSCLLQECKNQYNI